MASLYLHIPFCEKKCLYCDFYSIETVAPMESFLAALHKEIDLYVDQGKGISFETIFLGGGTPSLLEPAQLENILAHLHTSYSITPDAEITVEANPGTVDKEKLRAYRSLGVNRLSVGIQSFDSEELKFLSRIHTAEEAIACISAARSAGINNLSIDLIYSLPGQTDERWIETLHKGLALSPQHISAYSLIVEENTPLSRLVHSGQVSPNPTEIEARLYERTMEILAKNGFEHYEVSNYAVPGFRSRHNYNYWNHENYLGFGPSAHSFWKATGEGKGRRWWNIASISHYVDRLAKGELPLVSQEFVGREELLHERIMLGLRSDGIDLNRCASDFGFRLFPVDNHVVTGLLSEGLARLERDRLILTPTGYLLCDEITRRLLP
jgi:oxygen-independent coproporphyrinogen III oxidase